MRFGTALRRERPGQGYIPARHPLALPSGDFLGYYFDAAGNVVPHRLPAGWKNVRIRVPQRLATCEEMGHEGICGQLHKAPSGQPALYLYDIDLGGQTITHQVTQGEFIDRLAQSVDEVTARHQLGSYE